MERENKDIFGSVEDFDFEIRRLLDLGAEYPDLTDNDITGHNQGFTA
jgi:hypothetical protein